MGGSRILSPAWSDSFTALRRVVAPGPSGRQLIWTGFHQVTGHRRLSRCWLRVLPHPQLKNQSTSSPSPGKLVFLDCSVECSQGRREGTHTCTHSCTNTRAHMCVRTHEYLTPLGSMVDGW